MPHDAVPGARPPTSPTPPPAPPCGGAARALDRLPERWLLAGSFLAGLVLYLAAPSAAWSFDSVYFAVTVEAVLAGGPAQFLLPDHYPLYLPLVFALQAAARAAGLVVDTLYVMQALAAVFGALTLPLGLAFFRWLFGDRLLALACTLFLAVSLGSWHYATEAELYTICVFFLLGGYWLALHAAETGSARAALASGASLAGAVLLHLGPVVSGLALVWVTVWRRPRRLALLAAVGGVPALALGLHYTLKFALLEGRSPVAGLAAMLRKKIVLTEPMQHRFALDFGEWPTMVKTALSGTIADTVPGSGLWQAALGVALLAALALGLAGVVRPVPSRVARAAAVAALLLVSYFVFFLAYAPGNLEATPFFIVPEAILLGALVSRLSPRRRAWAASASLVAFGLLGAAHFATWIAPRARPENNAALQMAHWVGERTEANDVVVLVSDENLSILKVYVPYFASRQLVSLQRIFEMPRASEDPAYRTWEALAAAARARGGRVVLLADRWTAADVEEEAAERGLEAERFRRHFGTRLTTEVARRDARLALHVLDERAQEGPGAPVSRVSPAGGGTAGGGTAGD